MLLDGLNLLLDKAKKSLWITESIFDDQLRDLIKAGLADLGITDISSDLLTTDTTDSLIIQAVNTYVRLNFGSPSDYDRLKKSYDEQKAQLLMNSSYTSYSDDESDDSEDEEDES